MRRHAAIATDGFLPHDATPIATFQARQDLAILSSLYGTYDECRDYNLFIGDRPHAEGIVTANDQPQNRLLCGATHHCTTRIKRACRLNISILVSTTPKLKTYRKRLFGLCMGHQQCLMRYNV